MLCSLIEWPLDKWNFILSSMKISSALNSIFMKNDKQCKATFRYSCPGIYLLGRNLNDTRTFKQLFYLPVRMDEHQKFDHHVYSNYPKQEGSE